MRPSSSEVEAAQLDWFVLVADESRWCCQPSLGIEEGLWERSLTALGTERLENAVARVSNGLPGRAQI